jgi:enoyl-CoA hydratase/carnithine racemase
VPAKEGFELGFVNEVVPVGKALEGAKRWAAQILECSPMSIRASKEAVYKGLDQLELRTAYETLYPAVIALRQSEDMIEGPKAFAEKRKPNWKGR